MPKLGDWAISQGMFDYIRENFHSGDSILELGSGDGSCVLSHHYRIFSVEHDEEWLNKHNGVNYIYAPIKRHKEVRNVEGTQWYDPEALFPRLKKIKYDLLIVDGPPGHLGRAGLLKYWDQFPIQNVPIIFDDLHRSRDLLIARKMSARLKTPLLLMDTWQPKHWGVIWKGRYT